MPLHFDGTQSNAQLFSADCVISPSKSTPHEWTSWVEKELNIEQAVIMLIDDEPIVLNVLRKQLKQFGCDRVVTCSDSTKALGLLRELNPDVVLLDLRMPGMSGLEILEEIRAGEEFKMLPVLVMTASVDHETKVLSLLRGATDFLTKPLEMTEVMPRVRNAVLVKKHQDEIKEYTRCLEQQAKELERQVEVRTSELITAWQEAVQCLARAGEYRDDDTGQHVLRVGRYVAIISQQLGISESDGSILEQAAKLHDVGKIGISDTILLKPGKLTDEEFETIKQHCEFGRNILGGLGMTANCGGVAMTSPVMQTAAIIAETHHEWWDGSGYPKGLKGHEIPLAGRITAVADVYDALSSKRPYKDAIEHEKCLEIIQQESGSHFDPVIVDAFLQASDEILTIREKHGD